MNIRTIVLVISVMLIPVIAAGKEPVKAISFDTIQVLKISAQDGRAVIKTPDGQIQIIKVGDPIGNHAKVIEIVKNRVVIEEQKENVTENIIITIENGKQLVKRLKKAGDPRVQPTVAKSSKDSPTQQPVVQERQPSEVKK